MGPCTQRVVNLPIQLANDLRCHKRRRPHKRGATQVLGAAAASPGHQSLQEAGMLLALQHALMGCMTIDGHMQHRMHSGVSV